MAAKINGSDPKLVKRAIRLLVQRQKWELQNLKYFGSPNVNKNTIRMESALSDAISILKTAIKQ